MKCKIACIPFLVLLISFFGGAPNIQAQEVQVSASLDTMVMPIGEQQQYHLQVIQPSGLNIKFPLLTDTLTAKVEILSQQLGDTVQLSDDRIQINHDYLITSFDSGFYAIPPAQFLIETGQGVGQLYSDPTFLKVVTFEIDTAQAIFDIKEPIEVPYLFKEILPYIIGGVLGLLLIAGIVFLVMYLTKKNKGEAMFEKAKPVEPPHIIALRELQQIKDEKLWQTDRAKEFYTRLTDVIRVYIEGRYSVMAMEQTTFEIMQELRKVKIDSKSSIDDLRMILSTADLVKFAKQKPLPNENDLCLVKAIAFVEDTKLIKVESEEENSESEDALLNDKKGVTNG